MSQHERPSQLHVLKPDRTHLAPLLQRATPPELDVDHINPRWRAAMQRRVSLNLERPLVSKPESLDVLGLYYAGGLETHAALSLLAAQGVALSDAVLAVGRAQDIQTDVVAEGIVGTHIGDEVGLTTEVLEWWLAQIRDTELEIHVARGLWLINQLKPVLSASDMRELKARYVVHDIGKLGPLGLDPESTRMVLHSFELRRVVLQHPVARVFAEHFGPYSHRLVAEINRQAPQTHLELHTTMRAYFDHHEAWGEQRLAKFYAEGQVSHSVATQAPKHHHLDRTHAPLGLITYLDMYEASTGRMSYDAVTGQETRRYHAEAITAIWQRFDQVDRCKIAPIRVAEYTHWLTMMDRWAPHFSGSVENVSPWQACDIGGTYE